MFVKNGVDFSRWAATECIRINTVEHGYNDISLMDTSCAAEDVLLYQLISHCFTITLYSSVRKTLVYNDTKPFMTF